VSNDRADDVASPIDLRSLGDARNWAASALRTRPWRERFFERYIVELRALEHPATRLLELGSGPGFLAHRVLVALPDVNYVMLDFSPAMHELARERLGRASSAFARLSRISRPLAGTKGAAASTPL
jgi:ubiquinone/menaquinone biosynthesis C-methylase UbiE